MKRKEIHVKSERYYLINKKFMEKIKIECNFNEIKKLMEDNNIRENDDNWMKKILFAFKKLLPINIIKKFLKESYLKSNINIEPNITSVNYFDKLKKSMLIYDDFEIIEREIIKKFIYNLNIINNYFLECIINEGKIIINYPNNFNSIKFISVIGTLNKENIFITEYILIYDDINEKINHINKINGRLNKYLNELQLYNNSQPIINNQYKEIGIIAKCEANNNIENQNKKNNIPQNKIIENNKNMFNDEYNLNYQTDKPYIKYHFNYPPLIGLENIGATCYMNSTLQCFCHIEKFIEFFKYSKQVINITKNNKNNLTSSFKLLIEKLWPNNNNLNSNKCYAPEEFKNKISKMNPLFEGIAANDAKDLVNFIIMTLHEELNKIKQINNSNNNQIVFDQTNKKLMLNNFIQDFISKNQSIMSDLFYAMNCNITECCRCHNKIYNYQTYFFIIFPLEEVRKFKNSNILNFFNIIFNNNYNDSLVSIYDCFDYDNKINVMSGENSMYCNFCKINCACHMRTCLATGPEILILLLNRGHGIEFNVKINFLEELNLYNYIEYKETGCNYKLIGVITHIGESSMSGHFIAYCKDPITYKWHKYNDAIVSEVINFKKEVIDFAMPYLLFYQKIQ